MSRKGGPFQFAGAAAGAGIACVVVVLCGRPAQVPFFLLAGTAGGAVAATAAARLRGGVFSPIEDGVKSIPEVDDVYRQGYEIEFRRDPPSPRFQRYTFKARRQGRVVGRLGVDCIDGKRRLYVENVYVADAHGRRGLGTALLLSAAKTTDCAVVTTSGRTNQGAAFFARNRSVLKRHGVELRDGPA